MRYSRTYSLPHGVYFTDAPVSVEAGALLWDSEENHALAQLKLKNLSRKTISSVTLTVTTQDATGACVETQTHTYSGFTAAPDAEFGQQEAVALTGGAAAFTVSLLSVDFVGGSRWQPQATAPQMEKHACRPITGIRRWLPLLLAGTGVLLSIWNWLGNMQYAPEMLWQYAIVPNISAWLGSFFLPIIFWLLAGTGDYAKLRKPLGIVFLAIVGVQMLAALLYALSLSGGLSPNLAALVYKIPGYGFLGAFSVLFKGKMSMPALLSLLYSACFIAKNLLAGIFLLSAKK